MAAKKIRNELESVRGDIKELTEAVWALRDQLTTEQAVAAAEQQTRKRRASQNGQPQSIDGLAALSALAALAAETAEAGYLSTFGVFASPNGETARHAYRWSLQEHPVTALLDPPIDQYAQVLAAIGHKQRLSILLQLLSQASTATDLVSALSLGTTGAAYHHLNVLQAAGLVQQEQRGIFAMVPDRVPALLTILAGLSGTIDVEVTEPVNGESDPSAEVPGTGKSGSKKNKKSGG
jgi:DNA gyrase subunit B